MANIFIPSHCRCPIEGLQQIAPGNVNNSHPLVNGSLPSSWGRLDSREQQAKNATTAMKMHRVCIPATVRPSGDDCPRMILRRSQEACTEWYYPGVRAEAGRVVTKYRSNWRAGGCFVRIQRVQNITKDQWEVSCSHLHGPFMRVEEYMSCPNI